MVAKDWLQMGEQKGSKKKVHLNARLVESFREAYPELAPEEAEHAANNMAQIVSGVISIGEKTDPEWDIKHVDVANALVYWCVSGTPLEKLLKIETGNEDNSAAFDLESATEARGILVARAADFLLALGVLSEEPDLFSAFIKGSVSLGTSDWQADRGKLRY